MLYTKNGSIPKPETDGTEGWIEAPMPPDCPEGKEVVWLNWQWIIRDPKPTDNEGYRWKWSHDKMAWIEYELSLSSEYIANLSSSDVSSMTTEQIDMLNKV